MADNQEDKNLTVIGAIYGDNNLTVPGVTLGDNNFPVTVGAFGLTSSYDSSTSSNEFGSISQINPMVEKESTTSEKLCYDKLLNIPRKPISIKGDSYSKIINSVSSSKVDKRVTLTCCPKSKSYNITPFAKKIHYVLGKDVQTPGWLNSYGKFYGLLYNSLSSSAGLIFPYTPKISFTHSVGYETTEIIHSNLSFNSYKNTPPPTIGLDGKFTADTRENALHMLSAIWFCIACTKCEFGEKAAKNNLAGLPPPVLYLSGYDNLIDNIPVIISQVSYTYPEDLHYVNLVLDMSKDYTIGEDFCSIYTDDELTTTEYKNTKTGEISNVSNVNGRTYLSFWLPTELTLQIQFKIQPNLTKTKKIWNLDDYKTGLILTNKGKTVAYGTFNTGLYEYTLNDCSNANSCDTKTYTLPTSQMYVNKETTTETRDVINFTDISIPLETGITGSISNEELKVESKSIKGEPTITSEKSIDKVKGKPKTIYTLGNSGYIPSGWTW